MDFKMVITSTFLNIGLLVAKLGRASAFIVMLLIGVSADLSTVRADQTYTFGVVPQYEPRKLAKIWLPILEELKKRTGLHFRMVGSPKIPDFETSFLRGEFDFAFMNPYHAMLAITGKGYSPLVNDRSRQLFGILVVRKDDPIKSVNELQPGGTIAFPAPNALGASLLMRADLSNQFRLDFNPVYVLTHSSVYLNVVLGKMRAGGGVMSSLKGQKRVIQDNLRVLYETRGMSPHPIMAHSRVSKAHKELVRQAFLQMGQTEEGKKLLAGIPINEVSTADKDDYLILAEWGLDKFYVEQ